MSDALVLQDIHRTFQQGDVRLEVLRGAELSLRPGELVALVGPSGAGKSTLLQVAGLLERPDSGRIVLGGEDCQALDDTGRTLLRRQALGFVYQFHHLLPEFTALENVMMPMLIAGTPKKAARDTARDLLDRVGLAQRAEHRPSRLSGGEQQRVAIVRALANGPRVLLADEPTGNLDPHTADGVLARFLDLARQTGLAALVATHNPELARALDRTVILSDGKLTAA